jgi:hypothetical protein
MCAANSIYQPDHVQPSGNRTSREESLRLYDAHLHLEIRKNIEIGMSRAAFARDSSDDNDPSHLLRDPLKFQGIARRGGQAEQAADARKSAMHVIKRIAAALR